MNEITRNVVGTQTFAGKPVIVREARPGMEVTRVSFATHEELHFSLRPIPSEQPLATVSRLVGMLKVYEASVVRHEVFGSLNLYAPALQAIQREVEEFDWPVSWVEGKSSPESKISGMHVFAVTGIQVETILQDGRPVGRRFSDGDFKHCFMGGISPSNRHVSKSEQCRETLERLADALGEADLDMTNVVRTWFFLEDILGWYGDFNQVRNEFFRRMKMFNCLMSASTGIGGRNPGGGAVVAGVWAVEPENEFAAVREVVSPLQCPATSYGSAFSRAVLLEGACLRRLLVSGTASIAPGGQSQHDGNWPRQIATSKMVAQRILHSCGFDFEDVNRATGYFKDRLANPATDSSRVECRQAVDVQADICRQDLLFEIELDAVSVV